MSTDALNASTSLRRMRSSIRLSQQASLPASNVSSQGQSMCRSFQMSPAHRRKTSTRELCAYRQRKLLDRVEERKFPHEPDGLVDPDQVYKRSRRAAANQQSVMEQGSDALLEDIKMVQKSYTGDLLSLTIAAGYLARMLENARIERHLVKHHPDIFQAIQEVLKVVHEEKARVSSGKQITNGVGESQSPSDTISSALSVEGGLTTTRSSEVPPPSTLSGSGV